MRTINIKICTVISPHILHHVYPQWRDNSGDTVCQRGRIINRARLTGQPDTNRRRSRAPRHLPTAGHNMAADNVTDANYSRHVT